MKTNETMPGAARHRDASANGPSVAEIVKEARATLQNRDLAKAMGLWGTVLQCNAELAKHVPALLDAAEAAPLPIPRQLEEALREAADMFIAVSTWVEREEDQRRLLALADKYRAALAGAQPKEDSSS